MGVETEKRAAAEAAAQLVKDGMRVGLGTGSTVAFLLAALARLNPRATYVATSPATEQSARSLGMDIEHFDDFDTVDLAIDGADQVSADGWLVKGGGGAHTREKIVAASAGRFVIIVDSTKIVETLHAPVPLELVAFGVNTTLSQLAPAVLRDAALSPDGGVIADFQGSVQDPGALSRRFCTQPGVIEHGLFPPHMVSELIVGMGTSVRRSIIGGAP